MLVAAYLVGGFLIASVYAVGHAPRPTRPLPPARVPDPVHGRRDRDAGADGWSGDTLAAVGLQQRADQVRRDRARARRPRPMCPRRCSGISTRTGTVTGGIRDPGPGVDPVGSRRRHEHRRSQGLDATPASRAADDRRGQRRPPRVGRHGRHRHAAVPAVGLVRARVAVPPRHAQDRGWFLWLAVGRRGARRSSRWRPAGWSPRSVANRGSSTAT